MIGLRNHLWRTLIASIALLAAGCATPTPEAGGLPTATRTATRPGSTPTLTPTATRPTSTSTPTALPTSPPAPTPTVPLATAGSRLFYRKGIDGQQALAIVDPSGQGCNTQALPRGAVVGRLAEALSPDGRWLAFHTGTAEARAGASYDLTLNLIDLSTGQTRQLTPLLSPEYPQTFQEVAGLLAQEGITLAEGLAPSVAPDFLRAAFLNGIHALAWSPSGRYLAFAGQMEGPSSDLYVYDSEAQAIQRLDDGLEQLQSITWSPDGRWILYGSAHIVRAGADIHYHAATVDGASVEGLSSSVMAILGWLNPSTYLQSDATHGPAGTHRLQSINIESGVIETLWEGTFLSLAVDPANDMLAIAGFESVQQEGGSPSLFLINLADGNIRKIKETVADVAFLGILDKRFMATGGDGTWFVLADGSLSPTGFGTAPVKISPELRYVVALGEALRVYAWGNDPLHEIALPQPARAIEGAIWRPDAPGLLFTLGSEMYAVNLLEGTTTPVDDEVPENWALDYAFSAPVDSGPEAVWEPSDAFSSQFNDCRDAQEFPRACLVAVMQSLGASPEALAFSRLLYGEAYMIAFEDCGTVDLARVIYHPRPSDMFQYVLVNGTPRVVYAAADLGGIDIAQAPQYAALAQTYPELTLWESRNNFEEVAPLPSGGQRFIFSYDLMDGCHICRTGSVALVAFDFDRSGRFIGAELLRLE